MFEYFELYNLTNCKKIPSFFYNLLNCKKMKVFFYNLTNCKKMKVFFYNLFRSETFSSQQRIYLLPKTPT